MLDESIPGETMKLKVTNTINETLKYSKSPLIQFQIQFLKKNRFLPPELCRIFCNVLIQPHFEHACPVWYQNLTKTVKEKLQITQNKCIQFCIRSDKMHHVTLTEFRSINWLATHDRVHQCINAIAFVVC